LILKSIYDQQSLTNLVLTLRKTINELDRASNKHTKIIFLDRDKNEEKVGPTCKIPCEKITLFRNNSFFIVPRNIL